nr:MAG TPA: hypothetical protein [Caudoviricetes sp.]
MRSGEMVTAKVVIIQQLTFLIQGGRIGLSAAKNPGVERISC